jgi:hypothetical protein
MTFLHSYSPNLAPVEIAFGLIKKVINTEDYLGKLHFNRESGQTSLFNAMVRMKKGLVIRLWLKFIEATRECLLQRIEDQKQAKELDEASREGLILK